MTVDESQHLLAILGRARKVDEAAAARVHHGEQPDARRRVEVRRWTQA